MENIESLIKNYKSAIKNYKHFLSNNIDYTVDKNSQLHKSVWEIEELNYEYELNLFEAETMWNSIEKYVHQTLQLLERIDFIGNKIENEINRVKREKIEE